MCTRHFLTHKDHDLGDQKSQSLWAAPGEERGTGEK